MARAAAVTSAIRLDPARVHAWRVGRQLLGTTAGAGTDPVDVARTLVGVQAQVLSSAALAIAMRTNGTRARPASGTASRPARTDATTRALVDRRLVRSWAMRSTLHLLAADDVPTVAAALGGRERWRRPAWLRWFGLTASEMDALIEAIGEILDDGRPRTRAELAEQVGARLGEHAGWLLRGSWGGTLKVASDRYYLVQSAEDERGVRFVRASRWIEGWREEAREEALAKLVVRYLAAYGPASSREVLRWWGLATTQELRPILERLGDALTHVEVDGARALVRTEDLDAIESTRPRRGTVHLLGGFDPMIVGAGLRDQLLPPAHLQRVSRTAGWISPVVLVDGRAAGVWDSKSGRHGLSITVDLFDREPARGLGGAIDAAATRVGEAVGLPVTVRHGPVFVEPRRAVPFNDR